MTQSEWEPIPEGESWQEKMERIRQTRAEYELLRAQSCNTFLEVLSQHSPNTLETVKEIGWYLWGSLYIGSRYRHRHRYSSYYKILTPGKDIEEKELRKYEDRFIIALDEWKQGRKSRRLGVNFLAFVCGVHKSTISRMLSDWARKYRHDTGNETPEELAWAKTFNLLFVDADEYKKIMRETPDIFEAAERCETRRLEILVKRKRFDKLFKRLSSNLWVVVKRGETH